MGLWGKPIWCIACLLSLATAQTVSEPYAGVRLQIRLAQAKSQFHVGETIPIELSFSTSVLDTYWVSTRMYDRSGRLNMENFEVTPPGRDPLSGTSPFFSIGGGLGSSEPLGAEPKVILEELNEWVALDQPGHYRLRVSSTRVQRGQTAFRATVPTESNEVEFDVAETGTAWQQQALASAVATLDLAASTDEEKRQAWRQLRFMDTADSLRELARRLTKPGAERNWDVTAGLLSSRRRQLVASELDRLLPASGAAVTADMLSVMIATKFLLNHDPPLQPYPGQDEAKQKDWAAVRDARMGEFGSIANDVYSRAEAVVALKSGAAKAETIYTLLSRPYNGKRDIVGIAPGLRPELAGTFLMLPPRQQEELLRMWWVRIKSAAMAAPLSELVRQPQIQSQMLRDLALRRLYEVDPDGGTAAIVDEIRHPHVDMKIFTVSAQTLSLLPNTVLPPLDHILLSRLDPQNGIHMGQAALMLGRYGSPEIAAQVRAIYEPHAGQWACDIEDGLLAYFLRVDPSYGVAKAKQCASICTSTALKLAVELKLWPQIEPGVVARLHSDNENTAYLAIQALQKFGDVAGQKALWDRLQRLHDQWADRADELRDRSKREVQAVLHLEYALTQALGRAHGWLLDDTGRQRLLSLLVSEDPRAEASGWQLEGPIRIHVSDSYNGGLHIEIAQYAEADVPGACAKLAQFPPGTRFQVEAIGTLEAESALKRCAEQNGTLR